MKSEVLELSRRIVAEQRFLALKDSPKFQKRTGSSSRQGAKYIEHLIFATYTITAISMVAFSSFLVITQLHLHDPLAHLQTLSIVLYAYIFLISLYSFIMFTNIVRTYHLFEPLKALPTKVGYSVLPLSWFVFTGSSSLFVIIPLIWAYVAYTGNLATVLTGIIWAFIMLALGYIGGSVMVFALSGGVEKKPGLRSGSLSSILRVVGFIAFFVLFEIAIQIPQDIPTLPPVLSHQYYMAVPLLNVAYISFHLTEPAYLQVMGILISAVYLAITAFAFYRINLATFNRITQAERPSSFSSGISSRKLRESRSGLYVNLFRKEIRNIFRKSQNFLMMLIPIFLVLPTLLSIFFYSSDISFGSISVYYSMLSIVIVSSAFYSLVLIISEGGGISIIQSLPV